MFRAILTRHIRIPLLIITRFHDQDCPSRIFCESTGEYRPGETTADNDVVEFLSVDDGTVGNGGDGAFGGCGEGDVGEDEEGGEEDLESDHTARSRGMGMRIGELKGKS